MIDGHDRASDNVGRDLDGLARGVGIRNRCAGKHEQRGKDSY
jgi:hypothetical protein